MAVAVRLGQSRGDARQQAAFRGPDRRGAAARRFEDRGPQALGDDARPFFIGRRRLVDQFGEATKVTEGNFTFVALNEDGTKRPVPLDAGEARTP